VPSISKTAQGNITGIAPKEQKAQGRSAADTLSGAITGAAGIAEGVSDASQFVSRARDKTVDAAIKTPQVGAQYLDEAMAALKHPSTIEKLGPDAPYYMDIFTKARSRLMGA
jgi:hypothetical protein